MTTVQRGCRSKKAISSLRCSLRLSWTVPPASTPWSWNTDLAISRPIMVMLTRTAPSAGLDNPHRGTVMPLRAVHPIWFTPEAVAAWKAGPRTGRGARHSYSALAIATALTLRAVFRLALRQTEGLIASVLQLLGLDLPVPDHSTLSRRAATLEVPRPKAGSAQVHLLVDSTGLKLCGPGEWPTEKHGTKRRRAWRVLHLATDADTRR